MYPQGFLQWASSWVSTYGNRKVYFMTISERIFLLLEEKGISQLEFSKGTGIAQSTVSDWKRKGTNPNADKIAAISKFLGVSLEWLLEGGKYQKNNQDAYIVYPESSTGKLIQMYNSLSYSDKNKVQGYVDALAEK